MTKTQQTFSEKLKYIIKSEPKTIRSIIAQDAFRYDRHDPDEFFVDLMNSEEFSGHSSAFASSEKTRAFFDKYYDEIHMVKFLK